jgi:hypothetical protein
VEVSYSGDCVNSAIAVTKNATSFQDSRPPSDATPVTVLLETPTLPVLRSAAAEAVQRHHLRFVSRSITISQLYRSGRRTSSFTIQSSTVLIFPYTSYFNKRTLTSWSRTTEATRTTMAPSGWVIGTETEIIWDCQGVARGYPMQSHRAEGYACPYLFLTHYIRYYGIKTSDNLRVTSYCDSESLSRTRIFSYPDVDSSSWYLKSDHDVIMKLSSVRKDYHLNSSHDTSRVTKTTSTNTTTSLDRATQRASRPPRLRRTR